MNYDAIKKAAEGYRTDMAKFLRDMIAIPSESCEEEGVVKRIAEELKALLAETPYPDRDALAALDDRFIAENLSPGGSADLLALTWLLHFVTTEGNINE